MVQKSRLIDGMATIPLAATSLFGDIPPTTILRRKRHTVTFGTENRRMHPRQRATIFPSVSTGDPQTGGTLLTAYHTDVDVQAGERIEPPSPSLRPP